MMKVGRDRRKDGRKKEGGLLLLQGITRPGLASSLPGN